MTDEIITTEALSRLIKQSGLDFASDTDYEYWNQAVNAYNGDNLRRDLPGVLEKAATRKQLQQATAKQDGVAMLDALNRLDGLGETTPMTPKQDTRPLSEQDGVSILDRYNAEHPL